MYVNAKQYHRILKRRAARAKLEEMNRMAKIRKVSSHICRTAFQNAKTSKVIAEMILIYSLLYHQSFTT